MAVPSLKTEAGVIVKTTLVDFPGRVACAFFLRGCNLRCPYCYNKGLVIGDEEGPSPEEKFSSIEELFAHLEKRKNVLSGLTISGGEPLLNPLTPRIAEFAKSLGYNVKLDTNGTLPDALEKLVGDEKTRPDFIAMDIKTSPHRYAELLLSADSGADFPALLARSAKIVASYPKDSREWRTVLVPTLVKEDDIREMARLLPSDAAWRFAQFRNEGCLDSAYDKILPYTDKEAAALVDFARTLVSGAALR